MRVLVAWAAILLLAPTLNAEPTSVKVTRVKIQCEFDHHSKEYDKNGKLLGEITSAPKTESLRTTWTDGDVEYRVSESKSFSPEDNTVMSTSHAIGKLSKKQLDNGLVVESYEGQIVKIYDSPFQMVRHRSDKTESTYKVEGATRILVRSIENGKEGAKGDVEVETRISDKITELKVTSSVPDVLPFADGEGFSHVLKSEAKCRYETLD